MCFFGTIRSTFSLLLFFLCVLDELQPVEDDDEPLLRSARRSLNVQCRRRRAHQQKRPAENSAETVTENNNIRNVYV